MNKASKYIYTIFVYIFLYLPIVVVVVFSFNDATRSLIWKGFTFRWYSELLHDTALLIVAYHSIIIALLAATFATFLGTLAAVSLYRYQFLGKKILHGLIYALILFPEIVMGISLLLLYSFLKIPLGFWTLLLAHITLCLPFVSVTIFSRITSVDSSIFEAAMDLGATDLTIFTKIVFPLLLPAIAAGWLLSFTLSLDDVIISYFVTGPTFEILPLKIYAMVRLGVKPEVNALCTLLLLITLFVVLAAQTALRKNSEKVNF
ncbi:MAG: spermidine/putrescine ABC transporter permease PotC [Gammaproteobacteria bacterium]|nr:spermidine/putrescine ABC transporter permease PotC [Gammaproteobacteria bacterium]